MKMQKEKREKDTLKVVVAPMKVELSQLIRGIEIAASDLHFSLIAAHTNWCSYHW